MRKVCSLLLCVVVFLSVFTACSTTTNRSYTFNVSTGDSVAVSMLDTDGYSISPSNTSSITFEINGEDKSVQTAGGVFLDSITGYNMALEIKSSGTAYDHKNIKECYEYTYNDGTNDIIGFVGIISDKTYILVNYNCDKALAEKLFDVLSFSIEK